MYLLGRDCGQCFTHIISYQFPKQRYQLGDINGPLLHARKPKHDPTWEMIPPVPVWEKPEISIRNHLGRSFTGSSGDKQGHVGPAWWPGLSSGPDALPREAACSLPAAPSSLLGAALLLVLKVPPGTHPPQKKRRQIIVLPLGFRSLKFRPALPQWLALESTWSFPSSLVSGTSPPTPHSGQEEKDSSVISGTLFSLSSFPFPPVWGEPTHVWPLYFFKETFFFPFSVKNAWPKG